MTHLAAQGKRSVRSRVTRQAKALEELHKLCRRGHLYGVEDWIQQDRPLQIASDIKTHGRYRSALAIALETSQYSLCLLLLRSGYPPDAERCSPFDIAIKKRRKNLVDLLFELGADPHRVSLWTLFDSYASELFERFQASGVDLTTGHEMADHLAEHASNKPLFGFARQYRITNPTIQIELDMALGDHVREGNEKGVLMCLWAGANPRARVPDLRYGQDDDLIEECPASTVFPGGDN